MVVSKDYGKYCSGYRHDVPSEVANISFAQMKKVRKKRPAARSSPER